MSSGRTPSYTFSMPGIADRDPTLQRVTVIHRVGALYPGDEIVFVGVTGAHRGMAFAASEFIMDYLKTRAPFWKREATGQGDRWVDARDSDRQAAQRWHDAAK